MMWPILKYAYNVILKIQRNEPCNKETGLQGFPTRSVTNRPVQSQKKAKSLKFEI